jgi:hypothetical protein
MHFVTSLAALAALAPAIVTATLDPASSNTKGYKPSRLNCEGTSPIHIQFLPFLAFLNRE